MDARRESIPKQIYLFWNGPVPPVVQCCMDRIRAVHDSTWSVNVLNEVEERVEGVDKLTVQWTSDWVRICAMQKGGVWLDASCICIKPVDHWVDMSSNALQGYSFPLASDCLENWAFAAPQHNPTVIRWKEIFRGAIAIGFDEFKRRAPDYIRHHEIFNHMPYLTMHACYMMAVRETGEGARLTPSCKGPFKYLCDRNWNSRAAVKALMHKPLRDPPPLIKLRGAETSIFALVECKWGSLMHSVGMRPRFGQRAGVVHAFFRLCLVAVIAVVVLYTLVSGSRSSPVSRCGRKDGQQLTQ